MLGCQNIFFEGAQSEEKCKEKLAAKNSQMRGRNADEFKNDFASIALLDEAHFSQEMKPFYGAISPISLLGQIPPTETARI